MLRVTLRGVQGHLLRFVLTVLSVTLGVAFVAGTFVLTDSLDRTFSSIVDQGTKGLDVQVRGQEVGRTSQAQGGQAVREQLPLSLQDTLRQVPGRVVLVRITQPADANPGLAGDYELTDCETDVRLTITADAAALTRYRAAYAAYFDRLSAYATQAGVRQATVDASADVLGQLERLFPGGVLSL